MDQHVVDAQTVAGQPRRGEVELLPDADRGGKVLIGTVHHGEEPLDIADVAASLTFAARAEGIAAQREPK